MRFLEEFSNAVHGLPSRVRFTNDKLEGLDVEENLKSKGYEFAFGYGFKSRQAMVDALPDRSEAQMAYSTLRKASTDFSFNIPPTNAQLGLLVKLGCTKVPSSKGEASEVIKSLIRKQERKINETEK